MIDVDRSIALIQRNFPHVEIRMAVPITRGWDSFVLEVNGELIFRFPLRDDVIPYLGNEVRLLPLLEQSLSTPIPHFEFMGQGDENYPYMFVGYRKLTGIALDDERISQEQLARLAPALANFLSELHSFPVEQTISLGVEGHTPEQWRERYLERYRDVQKRVFPLLDADLRKKSAQLWEEFLDDKTIFTFEPVVIHCDLACEHVLCDVERSILTGVIDWGDVTIGDPAMDFVGLHNDRGREFMELVLLGYRRMVDTGFWRRMDFYLRYGPFSELLYGAYEGNERFIGKGREGLRRMFEEKL